MKTPAPEKVSQSTLTFKVEEIEPLLSKYSMDLPPLEPLAIQIGSGETLVIRPLKKEEVPAYLQYLKKVMDVDHDFYDIVGVRVYAELLGWYRNRLKDPYQFVGLIDGQLVGLGNGRLVNEDLAISLHSMAYRRGGKIGAIMYYVKTMYVFDIVGVSELHSTFESYNGWKRYGLGFAQPQYPWPDYQHELGGATVSYITKDYWDRVVKKYISDYIGLPQDGLRKATKQEIAKNEKMILPEKATV